MLPQTCTKYLMTAAFFTLTFLALPAVSSAQEELREPEEVTAIGTMVNDTLVMAISPLTLPTADGDRTISTRLYNGVCPGPTWRVKAGGSIRVLLRNQLPPNPDQDSADQGNYPQRLNTTNLHVHGLNVSPRDSSDNVLQSILPGTDFQFRFDLPSYHAAGTYWYHPHHHTSTYGQVVSGLAGAIIVEDVDDPLVTDPALLAMEDRIFIFSSFVYDTLTNTLPYPLRLRTATALSPFQAYESPVYVNGMHNAKVTMRPGEIQRWRFINATFELNMRLRWLRIKDGDTTEVARPEIAVDGLYFDNIVQSSSVLIPTGSRTDYLVQAPTEDGRYVLQLTELAAQHTVNDVRELVVIDVQGDTILPPMMMPTRLPVAIVKGPVHDSEITGYNHIRFELGDFGAIQNDSTAVTRIFKIDDTPFDHDVVNITVHEGGAEEWIVENTSSDIHPFHIHVNEFMVLEKNGVPLAQPRWQDVLALDTMSTYKIRHRFGEHYGKTVLHCHYLPHEDWGMMQIVEILPKTSNVQEDIAQGPMAFPNPIVGRIARVNVRIPEFLAGRDLKLALLDVEGNAINTQSIDATTTRLATVDVSGMPAGSYYIVLDDGNKFRQTDKVVLVR